MFANRNSSVPATHEARTNNASRTTPGNRPGANAAGGRREISNAVVVRVKRARDQEAPESICIVDNNRSKQATRSIAKAFGALSTGDGADDGEEGQDSSNSQKKRRANNYVVLHRVDTLDSRGSGVGVFGGGPSGTGTGTGTAPTANAKPTVGLDSQTVDCLRRRATGVGSSSTGTKGEGSTSASSASTASSAAAASARAPAPAPVWVTRGTKVVKSSEFEDVFVVDLHAQGGNSGEGGGERSKKAAKGTKIHNPMSRQLDPMINAAFKTGDFTAISALIAAHNSVDVNYQRCGSDGRTALMAAAQHCNTRMVAKLLAKGADVRVGDKDGRSALDYVKETISSLPSKDSRRLGTAMECSLLLHNALMVAETKAEAKQGGGGGTGAGVAGALASDGASGSATKRPVKRVPFRQLQQGQTHAVVSSQGVAVGSETMLPNTSTAVMGSGSGAGHVESGHDGNGSSSSSSNNEDGSDKVSEEDDDDQRYVYDIFCLQPQHNVKHQLAGSAPGHLDLMPPMGAEADGVGLHSASSSSEHSMGMGTAQSQMEAEAAAGIVGNPHILSIPGLHIDAEGNVVTFVDEDEQAHFVYDSDWSDLEDDDEIDINDERYEGNDYPEEEEDDDDGGSVGSDGDMGVGEEDNEDHLYYNRPQRQSQGRSQVGGKRGVPGKRGGNDNDEGDDFGDYNRDDLEEDYADEEERERVRAMRKERASRAVGFNQFVRERLGEDAGTGPSETVLDDSELDALFDFSDEEDERMHATATSHSQGGKTRGLGLGSDSQAGQRSGASSEGWVLRPRVVTLGVAEGAAGGAAGVGEPMGEVGGASEPMMDAEDAAEALRRRKQQEKLSLIYSNSGFGGVMRQPDALQRLWGEGQGGVDGAAASAGPSAAHSDRLRAMHERSGLQFGANAAEFDRRTGLAKYGGDLSDNDDDAMMDEGGRVSGDPAAAIWAGRESRPDPGTVAYDSDLDRESSGAAEEDAWDSDPEL